MSDEERRQLSKDLESLQETLEAGTPAQIPLLDDIVDEEELRRHAPVPPRRKRAPRNNHEMNLQPPETGDLFDPPQAEADDEGQPPDDENLPPELLMAAEPRAREDDDHVEPVRYARAAQDADEPAPDTRDILKVRADRMVEDLVAEYSSEIIGRLKSELTERLYAILEDLDIDPDDDSRTS